MADPSRCLPFASAELWNISALMSDLVPVTNDQALQGIK